MNRTFFWMRAFLASPRMPLSRHQQHERSVDRGLAFGVALLALMHLWTLRWRLPNFDEIVAIVAARETLSHIPQLVALGEGGAPPLFHLLLHWALILSEDVRWLRALQFATGVAQMVSIYLLARELFDRRTALLAALVYGLSLSGSYEAREVRFYPLFIAMTYCSLWLAARFLSGRMTSRLYLAIAVPLHVAAVYTQYFFFYVIAFEGVLVLVARRREGQLVLRWMLAQLLVVIAFIPWVPVFLFQARKIAGAFYLAPPGPQVIAQGLSELWGGGSTLLVAIALATAAVVYDVPRISSASGDARERALGCVALAAFVVGFVLLDVGYSFAVRPIYKAQYLAFLVPAWSLLVARGCMLVPKGWLAAALLFILQLGTYLPTYFDARVPTYDALSEAYGDICTAARGRRAAVVTDDVREYGVGIWMNCPGVTVKTLRNFPHYGWGLGVQYRGELVMDVDELSGEDLYYVHLEPPGFIKAAARMQLSSQYFGTARHIGRRDFYSPTGNVRGFGPRGHAVVDEFVMR